MAIRQFFKKFFIKSIRLFKVGPHLSTEQFFVPRLSLIFINNEENS